MIGAKLVYVKAKNNVEKANLKRYILDNVFIMKVILKAN